jgi:hypothetical protein
MVIVVICSRRFRLNKRVDCGDDGIDAHTSTTDPLNMRSLLENTVAVVVEILIHSTRIDHFNENNIILKVIIRKKYNTNLQQSHNLKLLKLKSNLIRCQTLLVLDELRRPLCK